MGTAVASNWLPSGFLTATLTVASVTNRPVGDRRRSIRFGQEIVRSIDRSDEILASRALEQNRSGEASRWVNPDTSSRVSVTPTRAWRREDQEYSREYQAEVIVGGEKQQGYGTACRQPDGAWKVMN